MYPCTRVPRVPGAPPTATPSDSNFRLVGATEGCEGSNWGFLGLLNPSKPSPGVPRGPEHVYYVYQMLHLLPHPLNLIFEL